MVVPGHDGIEVFVHLAAGHDATAWAQKWRNGSLIGINDESPYGYARANGMGCRVTFSTNGRTGPAGRLLRLLLRGLLGFDYVHARRNRDAIMKADVVWTHTESQYLAVAMLLFLSGRNGRRPRLIGQSVWLFDRWERLSFLRRWLYARLIAQVDVLSTLSPDNAAIAARLFPEARVEFIPFGIPNEFSEPVRPRETEPFRVLCLGNDRHRDWRCAVDALGGKPGVELTILSSTASRKLAAGHGNVRVMSVSSNDELQDRLRAASVMLVPLKPNHHASGITVLQEAALFGLPIIATDTGGLKAYFDDSAVKYIRPSDPGAIRAAVREMAENPAAMLAYAEAAQQRAKSPDFGCEAYIRRHVALSADLLGRSPEPIEETVVCLS